MSTIWALDNMENKCSLYRGEDEKFAKDKNYRKIRDHCHFAGKYRGAAHSTCLLRFNVSNLKLVFHKGSNYDLASKVEGNIKRFGENVEKNKTFLFQ